MSRTIALFGAQFSPPGLHHRRMALELSRVFDQVVVIPCGPRPERTSSDDVEPVFRAAMIDRTFRGLERVRVDLFDLEGSTFTRAHQLERIYEQEGEVWHAVGSQMVQNGASGQSLIQTQWEEGPKLWAKSRFVVFRKPSVPVDASNLPPNHRLLDVDITFTSSEIRERVFHNRPYAELVVDSVANYIQRHVLYRGLRPLRTTRLELVEIRPLIVADHRNPAAEKFAGDLGPVDQENPNLIVAVGGDGTMLRAIRKHWRRRVPFYGVNLGHMGFLLNSASPTAFIGKPLVVQQLPLLWVQTESNQGKLDTSLAFNDAWVERSTGQTAWISVKVDGRERIGRLVADGALVSTAAGSTSYAQAMGAAPLPLHTPVLTLVGSNVIHPRFLRPAVLPLESVVELTTLDAVKRPLRGFVDGVPKGDLRRMSVRVSNIAAAELAFDPSHDPAEKLGRIQFPPPG